MKDCIEIGYPNAQVRLRSEVSADKLRGGYYTPPDLTAFCWRRALALAPSPLVLRVLEPTAGAGAFFSTLDVSTRGRILEVEAIEVDAAEAAKCEQILETAAIPHRVHVTSFLDWALADGSRFDIAIGNPPFVRFQFVSSADNAAISMLGLRLGTRIEGVSNLWMPILMAALDKLRIGGAAAFVVPAELFTGMSASVVRRWILENMDDLTVDLFPPGRFQDVLQEVVVLSGRKATPSSARSAVTVVQHRGTASEARWTTRFGSTDVSWMSAFLSPSETVALESARNLPPVHRFRDLARLQVSIVTGANDYFSVSAEELESFDLARWALPLLPRARHAAGLVWRKRDQSSLSRRTKAWLVHFAADKPSPEKYPGAARFLAAGRADKIPERYKCRVRSPWYRVPDVWAGKLLLSKRSHRFPRLILNAADSYTTDTIYRGSMMPTYRGRDRDLVALFHNSLTLLTAELEGRSFGGGVHELVPSEIGRLSVPLVPDAGTHFQGLDRLSRTLPEPQDEALIQATNEILAAEYGFDLAMMEVLEQARRNLMMKRLQRNALSQGGDASAPIDERVAV